ncbi:phosphatase PAP2 family protein [Streptomyces sp. SB3404]|uniref:Phosphatase PAP2 family protein n=1 Tax=Streptomyces boncukensis TaxID=2711219 RepID=A0A6G4X3K8_9ACTN|nr:phosphatase PAP2 family protein [Streptomyces boncukensis]NGO71470.1 phosphatase PAP2 family protein [Streptomyces boncukensis]
MWWAALPLLGCALAVWQVLGDGPLRRADERLGDALRAAAPPAWCAEPLADLGNAAVALPVLLAALLYALAAARFRRAPGFAGAGGTGIPLGPALCCAVAMALVPAVVSALKAWTDRPGPLGGTGYFPSGHAATAAVAFGCAVLLLQVAGARAARAWWTAAALLTALNGLGLVWRGYHWPLDVLASWCLSALLVAAAAWGITAFRRSAPPPRASRAPGRPGRSESPGRPGG